MDLATAAAIGYGILTVVGGVLGYTKAGSQTSLISGLISGGLLVVGGIAHFQNAAWGSALAMIVTITLIIIFSVRFSKTRRWMPAGLMVGAGILALLALVFR
jgi:uncharacterized membrane protein (UPF0136 family)